MKNIPVFAKTDMFFIKKRSEHPHNQRSVVMGMGTMGLLYQSSK
jgi:hypothetical protein